MSHHAMSHPSLFPRRRLGAAAASVLGLLCAPAAKAGSWPESVITIVVPSPPGSSLDQNVRKAGEEMARVLKQPIVIENRAGAGGSLALATVARAKPDGYTVGIANTASIAISPELTKKPTYDPIQSFDFIGRFSSQPNVLVVRTDLAAKSVAELTAFAKAHPDKLVMGSQGVGSTGHLSGEMYRKATGATFTHVPYRGGPQAIQDLLGGRVDFLFENMSTILPHVEQGKVRALAVTSAQRNPRLPAVLTMNEAGVKGYEAVSWAGMVVPVGTPADVVTQLNRALQEAQRSPSFNSFVGERGGTVESSTPAAFKAFATAERAKWGALVRSIPGLRDDPDR
jgi:tripartite-type tricarboxylate transporter receptor subunit TctC